MISLSLANRSTRLATLASALLAGACSAPGEAQTGRSGPVAAAAEVTASYSDIVDLADGAAIIAVVQVRDQAIVERERAPGLAPGHARLYVEARTEGLIAARSALGESLAFLADVPLDAKGKAPKLKKQRFLVFADAVPGREGTLQLVEPDAMLPYDQPTEQRVTAIARALAAPDAPPRIEQVRDVISVPGNLAGESETQMFLDTDSGAPVSLSVVRRPGMQPEWGVSWSEIVDQAMAPPQPETLQWYRLACSLPAELPGDAFLQTDRASREQARADYAYILAQLGSCARRRG